MRRHGHMAMNGIREHSNAILYRLGTSPPRRLLSVFAQSQMPNEVLLSMTEGLQPETFKFT